MDNKYHHLIKERKLHLTSIRLKLLEILDGSHFPLGIKELRESIPEANESTLYRNLKAFEREGLVMTTAGPNGGTLFEFQHDHHHHHARCLQCLKYICLNLCSLEKNIRDLALKSGFQVQNHSLELHGLCKSCQSK